jgi:cellulose synthase/poly-beta-1,6-N-acetylglucosamine synthase-like glycosyltransferase
MSGLMALCLIAFVAAFAFAMVVGEWREHFRKARTSASGSASHIADVPVTMIVPARNAADTITALLQDLYAQRYPKELSQVLVVDDHSTDSTCDLVRGLMRTWPGLALLKNEGGGKKAAITTGMNAASGEWVVITDADARCGPLRVERMMERVHGEQPDCLLMPVITEGDRGLLQRVQADEQAALLGVAAGTALSGSPLLANGANMAFSKAAFQAVRGFAGDRWASGDDIFLLQRMKRAGKRIGYLLDPEVVVTVQAEPDLKAFWQQRLRWAGKMRGVGGGGNRIAAIGLLLPWFLLYVTLSFDLQKAMGQGILRDVLLLSSAWLLWLFPILGLMREVRRFQLRAGMTAHRGAGTLTLGSLVLFSVYAPVIAVASLFVRPRWKGRRI